jgi:hypothetical protein
LELETLAAYWAAMSKTGSWWFCRKGHPFWTPWEEAGMRVSDSIWWKGIAEGGPQKAIRRWFWKRWGRTGGLKPELQNRFQLKCEMEFVILESDDGLSEFWVG